MKRHPDWDMFISALKGLAEIDDSTIEYKVAKDKLSATFDTEHSTGASQGGIKITAVAHDKGWLFKIRTPNTIRED